MYRRILRACHSMLHRRAFRFAGLITITSICQAVVCVRCLEHSGIGVILGGAPSLAALFSISGISSSARHHRSRQFFECRSFGAAKAGFLLLRVGEFRGVPKALPACLRPASPIHHPGADQIALYIYQPAKGSDRQPPGAGGGVRPRLGQ